MVSCLEFVRVRRKIDKKEVCLFGLHREAPNWNTQGRAPVLCAHGITDDAAIHPVPRPHRFRMLPHEFGPMVPSSVITPLSGNRCLLTGVSLTHASSSGDPLIHTPSSIERAIQRNRARRDISSGVPPACGHNPNTPMAGGQDMLE